VKPENVIVRDDGAIKVLDFGIARRAQSTAGEHADTAALRTVTKNGVVVGTPVYMAPEQMRNEELDGRTDQFAWGVMAYELLSGALPWRGGEDSLAIISQVLTEEPKPLREAAPDVPLVAATVVMRTLAKPRASRFATMDEVVAALEGTVGAPSARSLGVAPTEQLASEQITAPAQASSRAPRRNVAVLGAVAAIGLAAAIALALVFSRRTVTASGATASSASASATAASSSVASPTWLHMPKSDNPAALAAFRDACLAMREADYATAVADFSRAVELDPTLVAADLRLLINDTVMSPSAARERFQKVRRAAQRLDERDRRLLEALEPFVIRDPSDIAECARRFDALAADYPDDPEVAFWMISIEEAYGNFRRSLEVSDHLMSLDDGWVSAWIAKGHALAYLGDFDAALRVWTESTTRFPFSTACREASIELRNQLGECAANEQAARAAVTLSPRSAEPYRRLAAAMTAMNREESAVLETLRQNWSRGREDRSKLDRLRDSMRLALAHGRFAEAEKLGSDLEAAAATDVDEPLHATIAALRAGLLVETGRPKDAATVARDFFARRAAWSRSAFADDNALAADATPYLLAMQLHANAISRADYDRAHESWAKDWRAHLQGSFQHDLWMFADALPTETPDEARDALAARASLAPLATYYPGTIADAHIGRVLFLAGQLDDAIARLERGAANCHVLDDPIEHTRGIFFLAQAYDQKGDKARACAAYGRVLERWGAARPKSVTAERARLRVAALGCAR
jgi:serine/threonine-protein kinase